MAPADTKEAAIGSEKELPSLKVHQIKQFLQDQEELSRRFNAVLQHVSDAPTEEISGDNTDICKRIACLQRTHTCSQTSLGFHTDELEAIALMEDSERSVGYVRAAQTNFSKDFVVSNSKRVEQMNDRLKPAAKIGKQPSSVIRGKSWIQTLPFGSSRLARGRPRTSVVLSRRASAVGTFTSRGVTLQGREQSPSNRQNPGYDSRIILWHKFSGQSLQTAPKPADNPRLILNSTPSTDVQVASRQTTGGSSRTPRRLVYVMPGGGRRPVVGSAGASLAVSGKGRRDRHLRLPILEETSVPLRPNLRSKLRASVDNVHVAQIDVAIK